MGVVGSGGAGSGGVRIEVEPQTLIRAGQRMGSLGSQVGMLSDALGSALASGIASGMDPAGANFGLTYGHQAQDFADALAKAANSFKAVGYMLEATGYNYKNADAASTVGGAGPTGGVGGAPSETTAADVPAGPNSSMVPPPLKWSLIQPFLRAIPVFGLFASAAMTWPSGNPSLMRLTAAQWRNLATGLSAFDDDMAALKTAVSVQEIPEGAKMGEALTTLTDGMSTLADAASTMAQTVDDFANGVQDAQDAIRRLLDRISLDGLWDTVTGFLTGEGDDILREVARDVGDVLENFQQQVKGIVGLLEELASVIGDAATDFQKWIRPILVEHFGDDVGGALADVITLQTDFTVGAVTGLIGTVSGTVAMADPDTWKGMADVAMSVAEDPSKLPGVLTNMGKEFVAWDKWSGEHPGRAAGEAAFNIGSLFVPGGPLTKTGTLAKGLTYGSRLLDEGRLPRLADLPGLGSDTRGVEGLDDLPEIGGGQPLVPEVRPGAVPDSVIGPFTPNGADVPSSPHGLGVPAGPPDPPGPTGTPGGGNNHGAGGGAGDGPPPDSPGRPVGPLDSGPGRVDGLAPQSPGPSPVDSQRFSEPSAPSHTPSYGDQTPPATQHAPESSSPAGTHDGGSSRSEPGSSPGEHTAAPEAPANGRAGGADDTGYRYDGNDAPSESHRPGANEYSGRPDERTHTPEHYQPAHSATESPSGNERPATDGSQTREQPQTSGDGDGRHNEPVGTTPGVMAGAPMPTASHAPGPTPSAADIQASAGKTHTPETTTRNPDARPPHAISPESPRAQQPTATGPAPGNMPAAPVHPASTQAAAGGSDQPAHHGTEPHAPRPGDSTRDSSPPTHPVTHETSGAASADRPGNQSNPTPGNQDASTGSAHSQSPDHTGPVGNPADTRVYGPQKLSPVENPAYQSAVESALRDSRGEYIVHADPRTNDYGNLINDGGPTVDGRSNNCLDCSLSALSSFMGDPTVSAPRYPDELPDGTIDDKTGEAGGLQRAADWLRGELLEFSGQKIADQFGALHQYIANLGPGSGALVVNGWHGRDLRTGEFLYHPDGSPITRGSHATVIVYPDGASGPVWWDPQQGLISDRPPSSMVDKSTYLHFTPIEPSQGVHHGGAGDHGTGAGVSGENVADRDVSSATVPARMGVHEGIDPGTDERGRGGGVGPPGDRFGDRDRLSVPELVGDDGGGSAHNLQTDGNQPSGPSDLSVPVDDHGPADPGGRGTDRVSTDGGIVDRSAEADPTASVDDREAHVHMGSEGFAVEGGDGPREVGEPSEPGNVAGSGHDPGVTGNGSDSSVGDRAAIDIARDSPPEGDGYPGDGQPGHAPTDTGNDHDEHQQQSDDGSTQHAFDTFSDRYVELEDGTQHRVWASSEQLRAMESRFAAADAWLAERGLTRADVQPLLVQPADWLNDAQRELVYGFRHQFPDVASGEGLQKVIDTGQAELRLEGGSERLPPDRTGGSVSVARDTHTLDTPDRIYDGLALEYDDTPFAPDKPVIAMRFMVDDVPVHVPDERLSERAGHGPSFDPGYGYPFTGTGFTASDHHTVPEYFLPRGAPMNPGAEMYRINPDGSEELLAVLGPDGDWIRVRHDE